MSDDKPTEVESIEEGQQVLTSDHYADLIASGEEVTRDDLTPEDQKAFDEATKQVREIVRVMKKKLKTQSKSQLIAMIVEQASRVQQLQSLCQALYEDNQRLLGIPTKAEKESNEETA